eukprot:CAMPEP_0201118746 /NCGR_PEP_ID=MMETSP0850-20130426/2941_1 /ASSEMBLY_ACC=CAM_ASM_000622 /TAXON_ID=183588 /ORGANISM="Pseudo-nitzschia fraudulenta, Strain WWA7" /LENGTH=172 /DNA_ID=CAMNT_0047384155 /DNA_START=177 /DNA_END=692 /DNA_ORIENTATION=+
MLGFPVKSHVTNHDSVHHYDEQRPLLFHLKIQYNNNNNNNQKEVFFTLLVVADGRKSGAVDAAGHTESFFGVCGVCTAPFPPVPRLVVVGTFPGRLAPANGRRIFALNPSLGRLPPANARRILAVNPSPGRLPPASRLPPANPPRPETPGADASVVSVVYLSFSPLKRVPGW